MKLNRPQTESQPRPPKAFDLLQVGETAKETDLIFDPEKDISKQSKAKMLQYLVDGSQSPYRSNRANSAETYSEMLILYQKVDVEPEICNLIFVELKELFDFHRLVKTNPEEFCEMAYLLVSCFPDRKEELNLSHEDFAFAKSALDSHRNDKKYFMIGSGRRRFSGLARWACVIFPDMTHKLGIGNEEFEKMKQELNVWRNIDAWWNFAELTVDIICIFPERKAEIEFGEEEFEGLESELETHRLQDRWWLFAKIAVALKFLTADRVKIDSNGRMIFFKNKKSISKRPKPLPQISHV